jgi:23S rRNA pseudouridine1911/1915/1917 synthase
MRVSAAGREAVTHYRVLAQFARHAHVELALETGRTHQIRVHMQHLGHPLLGDPTYGRRNPPAPGQPAALTRALAGLTRQALHARMLELTHPETGKTLRITSPLPRDFQQVLRALRAATETDPEDKS